MPCSIVYMKKAILIPDSFKGTMTSLEVCAIMEKAIHSVYPDCNCLSFPVADGGEGSIDAFLQALPGEKIHLSVTAAFPGEKCEAFYGLIHEGRTAIVELATCASLPSVEERKNPLKTTTYGVGELILASSRSGAEKIVVALGGSSTNDGGCGAAAACGVTFTDAEGKAFIPVGGTLDRICHIDVSHLDPALKGKEIVTMCDVNNPLCGECGASAVFGPQKGATAEMVKTLDAGLAHLSDVMRSDLGQDVSLLPGSGAAGGMGAGMVAFFGSKLESGIETVLQAVGFDAALSGCDCVFTGEGKIDGQSVRGKVVCGLASHAKKAHVSVVAVVGTIDGDMGKVYEEGVSAVFSILNRPGSFSELKKTCREDLETTMESICRLWKAGK